MVVLYVHYSFKTNVEISVKTKMFQTISQYIERKSLHFKSKMFCNCAWPAIADMNYLNSVIRVIKLLYMESMGNFYQSRTV